MTITHRDARILIREAFRRQFQREPSRSEAQFLQALSWYETHYGQAEAFRDTNNMGAVQAGANWLGPVHVTIDTKPKPGGTSEKYLAKFRVYATPIDGFADLVVKVYGSSLRPGVLPAAAAGNAYGFSRALYAEQGRRYYEGHGATDDDRVANHVRAIAAALNLIARELGEVLPDGSEPVPETIRQGDRGPQVRRLWERLTALEYITPVPFDTSYFGGALKAAVMTFQFMRGIEVDGEVGPQTWKELLR